MSGITNCGLTLSAHPDQLPAAIQWWRSLCEWIGGVGVIVLVLAMSLGGASGSTTGGIKVARLVWLAKNAMSHLQSRIYNREDDPVYHFDGQKVDAETAGRRIRYAALLAGLWVTGLTCGWLVLLLSMPHSPPVQLLFEAGSALGSVGLSTGVTQTAMPTAAKICLIVLNFFLMGKMAFPSSHSHRETT